MASSLLLDPEALAVLQRGPLGKRRAGPGA